MRGNILARLEADVKVEECLERIFHLKRGEKPVKTMDLAKELGFPPSTVSTLLKKLSVDGLVKYVSHRGVTLTDKGQKLAIEVVRRHRLSERLLTDVIGLDWTAAHDEACKLEHVISKEVAKKVEDALGNPETCPHGNPIPSEEGGMPKDEAKPLSEASPPEEAVVASVIDEDPKLLQKLLSLGILPGTKILIKERSPLGGPLILKVGDSEVAVGNSVASKIKIKGGRRARRRKRRGTRF